MSKETEPVVARFAEGDPRASGAEGDAARLFRQVDVPVKFAFRPLPRRATAPTGAWRRGLVLAPVALGLLLVAFGGVVLAGKDLRRRVWNLVTGPSSNPAPASRPTPKLAPPSRPVAEPAVVAPPAAVAPEPIEAPAAPAPRPVMRPAHPSSASTETRAPKLAMVSRPSPPPSERPGRERTREEAVTDLPTAPANAASLANAASPEVVPVPAPAPAPSAPAGTAGAFASPPETPLVRETRLLQPALAELRRGGDAGRALASLDDYLGRFPRGVLRDVAERARVDALIALGRHDALASSLEALTLADRGRDLELRVIRGELRARRNCGPAVDDFARAIGAGAPEPLLERALYGRAACLARLGHAVAARDAYRAYLERFPSGRFADEARRSASR